MSAALLVVILSLAAGDSADTLVVCPEGLQSSLEPWVHYRCRQGYRVHVIDSGDSAEGIRAAIRRESGNGTVRHLLLVGDAPPKEAPTAQAANSTTPTHYVQAKVNRAWGSEAEIATDNAYADVDGDGIPDLAVGRITADTPDQLAQIVDKIMAYESSTDWQPWRRRINIVAGVGGFGALADAALEMATRRLLTDGIPAGYHTTMTYGSWQSPYCPDPRRFHEVTLGGLTEGCLFWIYIGHGRQRHLDHVRVPGGAFHILDVDDAAKMQCEHGPPIALMLACYTAAFDHTSDCLAEEMLRAADGPVAVVGGSRVTMPYGMAVMATALMDEYFHNRAATLGQLLLNTKRRMIVDDDDDRRRQLLDAIAAAISPQPDLLLEERREHLALLNLIGDPLLRLRHPEEIQVQAPSQVAAGESMVVTVQPPAAGRCLIELVCSRDRNRQPAPKRYAFHPTESFLEAMDQAYRRANDPVWTARVIDSAASEFTLEIDVPDDARGPCYVRAYQTGHNDFAMGACPVFVRRPRP